MVIVSRLLEVVVILWKSVEKALRQNEEAQKYTYAKFGNVIAKYFQTFEVLQPPCAIVSLSQLFFQLCEKCLDLFSRMNSVQLLLYNWPHSCLQLQFQHSGVPVSF